MRVLAYFFILFCVPIMLYCDLLEVDLNGNYDYLEIQTAIEAAVDGDTILIHPGTYIENVNLLGKQIVLGSLFLTTGDRQYIANTIIDGNQSGSCVEVTNGETEGTKISGFTLTNGSGTEYLTTNNFYGGGIWIKDSSIMIVSCLIENNFAGSGGGISIYTINNIYLSDITIRNNQAIRSGGGINLWNMGVNNIIFDQSERCNIYNNYGCMGSDIYLDYRGGNIEIYADTLSVNDYWGYYIYQFDDDNQGYPVWSGLTIQMELAWMEPVDSDLYIAPWGNNSNSGFSPEEPLKTISWAMNIIDADANNQHTIFLDEGVYSPDTTGDRFPFRLKGGVTISGVSSETTILDGDNSTAVIRTYYCEGDIGINNLRVRNCFSQHLITPNSFYLSEAVSINGYIWGDLTIENVVFCDNDPVYHILYTITEGEQFLNNIKFYNNEVDPMIIGLSNFEEQTTAIINNIEVYDQYGRVGLLGNSCVFPRIYVSNLLMNNNYIEFGETGFPVSYSLFCTAYGTNTYMTNCTLAGNSADIPEISGAIIIGDECNLEIYNSIIYDNEVSYSILHAGDIPGHYLKVENCLIENGIDGIYNENSWNQLFWDYEDNLDCDPMFSGNEQHPLSLLENSSCIDAGTLDLPAGLELPETDIVGNPRIMGSGIDMGAYEYNPFSNTVTEELNMTEFNFYPNPVRISNCRGSVIIKYPQVLDESGYELKIYNTKGQRVWESELSTGYEGIRWDCSNTDGEIVSAGVYFLRLVKNGEFISQGKLTVVK
jgi:hypothetical protein